MENISVSDERDHGIVSRNKNQALPKFIVTGDETTLFFLTELIQAREACPGLSRKKGSKLTVPFTPTSFRLIKR